ncbi:MAG: tetratricopeptide repeat protein [Dysgonamonadaceae bacterium]|jgi:tetratricopeptide (TPR) repeat protein|nr:tetratricopeptide repeat protein [Dysgonamonadaceae bacterium]
MNTLSYLYCSLIGICNFIILREIFIYRRITPKVMTIAFLGAVVTLIGAIMQRREILVLDVHNPWLWIIGAGIPIVLALPFLNSREKTGAEILNKGKACWQRLISVPSGKIDPKSSAFQTHPKILEAKDLIRKSIDLAQDSSPDEVLADTNAAVSWTELGLLHRSINEFEEARSCFEKSLEKCDGKPLAYIGYGALEKRHLSALIACRETLFRLAELDHVMGNTEQARIRYDQSLEIDVALGHDDPIGETTTRNLRNQLT